MAEEEVNERPTDQEKENEKENEKEKERDIFTRFFRPDPLQNLFDPFEEKKDITIKLYRSDVQIEPETFVIHDFYSFFTLDDLKLAIYREKGKLDEFAPRYQFLATPVGAEEPGARASFYKAIDYRWFPLGKSSSMNLLDPFKQARKAKVNELFVDENGTARTLGSVDRGKMLFEELFLMDPSKQITSFTLFLYKDIYAAINQVKPLSEKNFYGRVSMYFPGLSITETGSELSTEKKSILNQIYPFFKTKTEFLDELNTLLESGDTALNEITLTGVKLMRFGWFDEIEESKRKALDSQFFELKTNKERPFIRFLPAVGTAITKIQMKGLLPIPDIEDPRLLLQWKDEKNPTPDMNFIIMKLLLQPAFKTQAPIYATLRCLDDGTADLTVQPTKNANKLTPSSELKNLNGLVNRVVRDLPFFENSIDIADSILVAEIKLERDDPKILRDQITKRIEVFRSFFQEIPSLNAGTLATLRYKAVSQFVNEDRISRYLTQLLGYSDLDEDTISEEKLIEIAEHLSITKEMAAEKIKNWLRKRNDVQIAEVKVKNFKMVYNPGIDITIDAKPPFYYFTIYRADSLLHLRRIFTLLSMMFSLPMSRFKLSDKLKRGLKEKEQVAEKAEVVQEKEEEKEAAPFILGAPNAGTSQARGAAATNIDYALAFAEDEEEDEDENKEEGERQGEQGEQGEEQRQEEQRQEENEKQEESEKQMTTVPVANFFINQLKLADSRLFDYTKDNKDIKPYVKMCAANETRQPAVLNSRQYLRMKEEYSSDPVSFIEFPLEDGAEEPNLLEGEVYTVLRYGTDLNKQNFYLCCEYFCTQDNILVRKSDFLSEWDRSKPKKRKAKESCPFCGGKEMKTFPVINEGETVYVRQNAPKSTSKHRFIGFLKKTPHPDKYALPCCFISKQILFQSNPAFQGDKKEDPVETTIKKSYKDIRQDLHNKYITEVKLPLEVEDKDGPQVGLLPAALNEYFGKQKNTDIVQRVGIRQEIKGKSEGFLRLGVQNRIAYRANSLFAAISPFLDLDYSSQVTNLLKTVITEKVFINLNYGNLLLEFFNSSDPEPNQNELRLFGASIGVALEGDTTLYLSRALRSYTRFKDFLEETDQNLIQTKEYRQFAPIFAEPGLLTTRGIVFIVLDLQENGTLKIRCPPYGFNEEKMRGCDIGFLFHFRNFWEPIVYTKNIPKQGGFGEYHSSPILFQRAGKQKDTTRTIMYPSWPEIIKKRVEEFGTQCEGPSTAAYTSSLDGIDTASMFSLTRAIKILPIKPHGLVRDIYNHAVAILIDANDPTDKGLVAIPIADNGFARIDLKLYFNWDQYTPARADTIIKIYNSVLKSQLTAYSGYTVKFALRSQQSTKIFALQLENGIKIPAFPPEDEAILGGAGIEIPEAINENTVDWVMNTKLYKETDSARGPQKISQVDIEEVYQHLRLTFSSWLVSNAAGGTTREFINSIISNKPKNPMEPRLPYYEKRKRLEIILSPIILKWLDSSDEFPEPGPALLRKNCIVQSEGKCDGHCIWKGSADKCMIHVPKNPVLGKDDEKSSDGKRLLILRLIDELINFPIKRTEVLENKVLRLAHLKKAIELKSVDSKGKESITKVYPEDSYDWFDLLRLYWARKTTEVPRFFEELSTDKVPDRGEADTFKELPEDIAKLLGDTKLKLWTGPEGNEWDGIFGVLGLNKPADMGSTLNGRQLVAVASEARANVVQLNSQAAEQKYKVIVRSPTPAPNEYIIFVIDQGKPYLLINPSRGYRKLLQTNDLTAEFIQLINELNPNR